MFQRTLQLHRRRFAVRHPARLARRPREAPRRFRLGSLGLAPLARVRSFVPSFVRASVHARPRRTRALGSLAFLRSFVRSFVRSSVRLSPSASVRGAHARRFKPFSNHRSMFSMHRSIDASHFCVCANSETHDESSRRFPCTPSRVHAHSSARDVDATEDAADDAIAASSEGNEREKCRRRRRRRREDRGGAIREGRVQTRTRARWGDEDDGRGRGRGEDDDLSLIHI